MSRLHTGRIEAHTDTAGRLTVTAAFTEYAVFGRPEPAPAAPPIPAPRRPDHDTLPDTRPKEAT